MTENKVDFKPFIPWIIFGALILGFSAIKVIPMTQEWLDLRDSIKQSKTSIQVQQSETTKLTSELQDITSKFEYEAKNYVLEETQIYPENFDAYKVSKILELYSIQHSLISDDALLRIERITVGGKAKKSDDATSQKTQVKIELKCSDQTLRRFVKFLQTGELPKELVNNANNKDFGVSEMEFLSKNKLPMAHIEAIQVTDKGATSSNIKLTSLDVTFFTQK